MSHRSYLFPGVMSRQSFWFDEGVTEPFLELQQKGKRKQFHHCHFPFPPILLTSLPSSQLPRYGAVELSSEGWGPASAKNWAARRRPEGKGKTSGRRARAGERVFLRFDPRSHGHGRGCPEDAVSVWVRIFLR
eukprot:766195-Hanusia_phi.AAC.17